MSQPPFLQACQYDIISKDALVWEKFYDEYILNPIPQQFYHRVYSNSLSFNPPTFWANSFQILINKQRTTLADINLDHIIKDMIRLLLTYPTVYMTIKTAGTEVDLNILKLVSELNKEDSLRIQYGIQSDSTMLYMMVIDVDLNYCLNKKCKKRSTLKKYFHRKPNPEVDPKENSESQIKPQMMWEIDYLNHNHGLRIHHPECLDLSF